MYFWNLNQASLLIEVTKTLIIKNSWKTCIQKYNSKVFIYLEKNGIDASQLSVARLRISTHLTCDTCVFIKSSIYNVKKSSFDELLSKDSTVSIHHQNIQKLGIKMFEGVKVGNHEIVNVILPGLRTFMSLDRAFFLIPIVNAVYRGAESVRIFDPKIWNLIPNEIKCL